MEMTDKELLERAAKAAGMDDYRYCDLWKCMTEFDYSTGSYYAVSWNPLTDDGDALRLMARLNINVSYRENQNGAFVVAEHEDILFVAESLDGPHEYDATRRAITRAAAMVS